ncbi:hypothetical protein ElyMa_006947100 [Elysia marginata]|uniref:Ig-like domain-containing protein n=1 Tax=Elysia marginata TaxID=1093978 RepID=A0AAV4JJK7_9GAST|nr:hypothetical protein ElyMa_006947100 [Elysia marginata]
MTSDDISVSSPSRLSDNDQLQPGEPLVIFCKPDLLEPVDNVSPVHGLLISRRRPGDAAPEIIVDFFLYHPFGVNKFVNSGGRDWTFEFNGTTTSRPDPGIKWTLNDASVADAAVYSCNVTFLDGRQLKTRSGQQEIKVAPGKLGAGSYLPFCIKGDSG